VSEEVLDMAHAVTEPTGRTVGPVSPRAPVTLGAAESARVLRRVLLPLIAVGPIVRRPQVSAHLDHAPGAHTPVTVLHELSQRYEGRPVMVRLGGRRILIPLDHTDALAVLDRSPDEFDPASPEKRAALRHFQPHAVLISPAHLRPSLRRWNEHQLDPREAGRQAVAAMQRVATHDGGHLADAAIRAGELAWSDVDEPLSALVRTVVLGAPAREDSTLTSQLDELRADANWAFARPRRRRLRATFTEHLADRVAAAPLGALAATVPGELRVAVTQAPHWLFAFDAARLTLWRALATLAARPELQDAVRAEAAGIGAETSNRLPLARACVLETLRLWPTTLSVLRTTATETSWGGQVVPAGTGVSLISQYLHRDPAIGPRADAFVPEADPVRPDGGEWAVIPFSAGPVACPGEDVVLRTTSHLLAALVSAARWESGDGADLAHDPVPQSLDHASLGLRAREV